MNTSFPSKTTFSCIRCFERKVKCDKQNPCGHCVKYNVQCNYRPRKPSRRTRAVKDELMDDRLKLYETILREKGIDPDQITGISRPETHRQRTQLEASEGVWHIPTGSTVSEPQATVFRPQLIQGQGGTKFVDK